MYLYSFELLDGTPAVIENARKEGWVLRYDLRAVRPGEHPSTWSLYSYASQYNDSRVRLVKTRTDRGLQTRYVRGQVSAEELRRAWITSPTDPAGPMPTAPQSRTVRALLYDGALLPGYAPGYTQDRVEHPDEVLDVDSLPAWQYTGNGLYSLGDRTIQVSCDPSGSAVYVEVVELQPTEGP